VVLAVLDILEDLLTQLHPLVHLVRGHLKILDYLVVQLVLVDLEVQCIQQDLTDQVLRVDLTDQTVLLAPVDRQDL
jgi:hypothetical protein